jgi:hypothetical protein
MALRQKERISDKNQAMLFANGNAANVSFRSISRSGLDGEFREKRYRRSSAV